MATNAFVGWDIFGRKKNSLILNLRLNINYQKEPTQVFFYRTDKNDPVQGGFEIQLMDNEGFQKKAKKVLPPRKLNGSFYDGLAPKADHSKPVGKWNKCKLTCKGPYISFKLNGKTAFSIDLNDWQEPGKNPDGSENKFKTALKDLPRKGRIGFQNHGQVVWFKNISIKEI